MISEHSVNTWLKMTVFRTTGASPEVIKGLENTCSSIQLLYFLRIVLIRSVNKTKFVQMYNIQMIDVRLFTIFFGYVHP